LALSRTSEQLAVMRSGAGERARSGVDGFWLVGAVGGGGAAAAFDVSPGTGAGGGR